MLEAPLSATYDDPGIDSSPLVVTLHDDKQDKKTKTPSVNEESKEVNKPDLDSGAEDTPIEKVARAQGWVSYEEWDGDPGDWRPADSFVERGQYFETMHKQNREIKKLNKQMDEQTRLFKKMLDKERADAIKALEEKKNQALNNGEYTEAAQVDSEIKQVQSEKEVEDNQAKELSTKEKNELLTTFVDKNPWYAKDKKMQKYADTIAAGYAQTTGTSDIEEVLEYVAEEVKARFPDSEYFTKVTKNDDNEDALDEDNSSQELVENTNPKKRFVSKVGSSSRSQNSPNSKRRGSKAATSADLNTLQRQVGERWVQTGAIESLDAYAKSLQEIGEIK